MQVLLERPKTEAVVKAPGRFPLACKIGILSPVVDVGEVLLQLECQVKPIGVFC